MPKRRQVPRPGETAGASSARGAVVFCNTKEVTREVSAYLNQAGTSAPALHGDLEQRDRDEVLVQYRQQSCRILVATDVAARGLDIDDLPAGEPTLPASTAKPWVKST